MTSLNFIPINEAEQLVSESVFKIIQNTEIKVAEIDPQYMNGTALSDHYGTNPEDGANCIIVRGKREGVYTTAAVMTPVGYRIDLNHAVPDVLGLKKVSMAPLDEVIQETGMEYGSITPVGLPSHYRILIDSSLMEKENIIVGGGKQISKILVPTVFLKDLPSTQVFRGLASPMDKTEYYKA